MICNYVFLEKKKQWMNEYICIFNYIYGLTYTHIYIYIYIVENNILSASFCVHTHMVYTITTMIISTAQVHHDNDHLDCPGLVHLEFATDWGSEQVR